MNPDNKPFFEDRRVWIVGATSGIGRALAIELASKGANILASGRDVTALRELASLADGQIDTMPLDVVAEGSLFSAIEMMNETSKLADTVIFMAAFYEPTSIHKIKPAELERTVRVNLWAPMELCRLITPKFYKRRSGQIAIVGSVAGYRGLPKGQPYSATKAALINFTETLFLEAKSKGVDVKLINPGFVETRMTDKNQFSMPDIISPAEAASHIVRGLEGSKFEIHFPKGFTRKLKILGWIPYRLYFKLARNL